jgi:hypothetical protein
VQPGREVPGDQAVDNRPLATLWCSPAVHQP